MASDSPRRPRAKRTAAGLRSGDKVRGFQQLTMRLPNESIALLKAIGRAVDKPAWRVMVEALRAYIGEQPTLSLEQRRATRALLRLKV